jgi:islet cell auto antigen 1
MNFYLDLESYCDRAIADCCSTVESAEKARNEYRGSLLWIGDISEELDPSNEAQMDKFRSIQKVVRANKDRFDQLKEDTVRDVV